MGATGKQTQKKLIQTGSAAMPRLVAIVGGSGSGKTWLADKLQAVLGKKSAARLSLDDFYRDRSHLSPARRALVNYDHPRAIDWNRFESVLRDCLDGRPTRVPKYDFAQHARLPSFRHFRPAKLVLVDGLWLLHKPALRRLFCFRIFIDCPAKIRLNRRLARDLLLRSRDPASVQRQFRDAVEPMNTRYVVPQKRWVHKNLDTPIGVAEVRHLAGQLLSL